MRPLPWVPFTLAALTLLLVVACGDDDASVPGETFPPAITIKQRDFAFDPTNATLLDFLTISSTSLGDAPTVRIENEGSVDHSFTIDEANVDVVIHPGDGTTIAVPADIGSAEYYCRFHKSQGMTGTITVAGSPTPDS